MADGPNYKHRSFILYDKDIEYLEGLVAEAKAKRGGKYNASMIIRYAIRLIDVNMLPDLDPRPDSPPRGQGLNAFFRSKDNDAQRKK